MQCAVLVATGASGYARMMAYTIRASQHSPEPDESDVVARLFAVRKLKPDELDKLIASYKRLSSQNR